MSLKVCVKRHLKLFYVFNLTTSRFSMNHLMKRSFPLSVINVTQCRTPIDSYIGLARTVYKHCIFGEFPAKITVYTPYIYVSGQPYSYSKHSSPHHTHTHPQIGTKQKYYPKQKCKGDP